MPNPGPAERVLGGPGVVLVFRTEPSRVPGRLFMTIGVPNLEYAPPVTRRKRWFRRVRRWAVFTSVAAAVWWAGPFAYRAGRFTYLQWACGRYALPPDTVVCDEPGRWGGRTPPFLTEVADPASLTELRRLDPMVYRGPLAGSQPSLPLNPPDGALLFMHWRTSPGGRERLVVVRRATPPFRQSWDIPYAFQTTANVRYGGPWSIPSFERPVYLPEAVPEVFADDPSKVAVRFYAGQADPDDPSRFTVRFEVEGEPGTLVGQLVDAPDEPGGVRVVLTRR
jgi:hypothetical protein